MNCVPHPPRHASVGVRVGARDERPRGVLWVWRDVHGERSARRGARVRRDVAFEVFALRRVRGEFVERVDVFRSRGRGRGDGG